MDYFTTKINQVTNSVHKATLDLIEQTVDTYFADIDAAAMIHAVADRVYVTSNPSYTSLTIDGLEVLRIYEAELTKDTQDNTIRITLPYKKDIKNGVAP